MVTTRRTPTNPPTPGSARKKNRVVPPKPVQSPDILRSPTSKIRDDGTVGSVTSAASSTSSRPGLAYHIQKQLAKDIELSGGIANFKKGKEHALSKLLDAGDSDIYGKRGDPIRSQLQKCVCRWIKCSREKTHAEKVLNRFSVKSALTLKKESSQAKKKGSKVAESSASEVGDESISESSSSHSNISSVAVPSKKSNSKPKGRSSAQPAARSAKKAKTSKPPSVIRTAQQIEVPMSPEVNVPEAAVARRLSSPGHDLPRNTSK